MNWSHPDADHEVDRQNSRPTREHAEGIRSGVRFGPSHDPD
jgi:hypothetical protein